MRELGQMQEQESKPSYSYQAANSETTKGKLRARTNGLALIVSSAGGFITISAMQINTTILSVMLMIMVTGILEQAPEQSINLLKILIYGLITELEVGDRIWELPLEFECKAKRTVFIRVHLSERTVLLMLYALLF